MSALSRVSLRPRSKILRTPQPSLLRPMRDRGASAQKWHCLFRLPVFAGRVGHVFLLAVIISLTYLMHAQHVDFIMVDSTITNTLAKEFADSCFIPKRTSAKDFATKGGQLGKPYINMGFPKMGSSTLHSFFNCGGIYSSHYWCGKKVRPCGKCFDQAFKSNTKIHQSCGGFDAYAEINYVTESPCIWPQITHVEELHQNAPNATFVLIFRNITSWVSSVGRWKEPDGQSLRQALSTKCSLGAKGAEEISEEDMSQVFCDQVNALRKFVKEHPLHALVEVQLEDEETASVMSNIFGIKDNCWGHSNKNRRNRP